MGATTSTGQQFNSFGGVTKASAPAPNLAGKYAATASAAQAKTPTPVAKTPGTPLAPGTERSSLPPMPVPTPVAKPVAKTPAPAPRPTPAPTPAPRPTPAPTPAPRPTPAPIPEENQRARDAIWGQQSLIPEENQQARNAIWGQQSLIPEENQRARDAIWGQQSSSVGPSAGRYSEQALRDAEERRRREEEMYRSVRRF